MKGVSSEAGAALTSLLLSGSSQKVDFLSSKKNEEKFLIFNLILYLWRKSNKKNMRTANYPTSESILAAKLLAAKGIDSMRGGVIY